ncbi:MAG TPA: TIGR03085 family metal-binding protein [Acidimicrobiales bacterium]|nr:TIGR03085 family metal-binding protein [Acidimicrobiales bacterium]
MTHFAQDERHQLCELLLEVGPDAPTLCDGWNTLDLAAHLVARERRPDSLPGNVVGPLATHTEKVRLSTREGRGWEELVSVLRSGPPAPLKLVDEPFNTIEFFVHHEDIRRASPGWEPRKLPDEMNAALWARLKVIGRVLTRKSQVGVAIEASGCGHASLKGGSPLVTIRGMPGELALVTFGRGDHARVEYDGDELSIERLKHAGLGL